MDIVLVLYLSKIDKTRSIWTLFCPCTFQRLIKLLPRGHCTFFSPLYISKVDKTPTIWKMYCPLYLSKVNKSPSMWTLYYSLYLSKVDKTASIWTLYWPAPFICMMQSLKYLTRLTEHVPFMHCAASHTFQNFTELFHFDTALPLVPFRE